MFIDHYYYNHFSLIIGVYKDKDKGKALGLEKTVFITVIAYMNGLLHYKVYFENFVCFAKHYNYDIIVVITHHQIPDLQLEIDSLTNLGVRVLTYSDVTFWTLMGSKKNMVWNNKIDKTRADYEGIYPNFQNYGALVMLVPILEILDLGYSVIFFDVDIGLIQDPIPYLIRGDADIVTSMESRGCPDDYPSFVGAKFDWENVEPNTGILLVRNTLQGVNYFRKWLETIVDRNLMNDQKAFDRDYSKTIYTPNCNWNLSANPTIRESNDTRATYCILSEILFQNGMTGFQCSTKPAHRANWILAMMAQGTSTINSNFRYPVTIHANYCGGKSHELSIRGLWLYEHEVTNTTNDKSNPIVKKHGVAHDAFHCKDYNILHTWYTTGLNWTVEYNSIMQERSALFNDVTKNNTLLKRTGGKEVYLIDEHKERHLIPDINTFVSMGFDFSQVREVPTILLSGIVEGKPIVSVDYKPPN